MRDQDPTLEQLFEACRAVERAHSAEHERLRSTVLSRIVGGGVVASVSTLTTKAAAGALESSATSGLLGLAKIKVGAGLLALASVTGVGAWLTLDAPWTSFENQDSAGRRGGVLLPAPGATGSSRSVATMRSAPPPIESVRDSASPPPTPPRSSTPRRRAQTDLSQELIALRKAKAALASGEPARALTLLDTYFQRYPKGVLLPEAKATRIRALCKAGLADRANQSAKLFEAAHRDSPLAADQTLHCSPAR